jgi:nitrilase
MQLKAAVLQAGTVPWDTPATLEKLAAYARQAAAAGAQLLVFPEAFIGGYPKGLDFGARLGQRTDAGRADYRRYYECSLLTLQPIADIAKEAGLWLTGGVIERDAGTLYCTAVYASPDGRIAGKHRKVMPTGMERLIWGFGDGSTLDVIDTPFGRLGAAICWENYMPQLRLALYGQNIQLYCAPTVDDRLMWQPSMRHIAVEGRCFVLSAVQWQPQGEWAAINGGSLIGDPFGNVLAGPNREGEAILYADIDTSMIPEGKYDLDVVGHYSRPDIFRLLFNRSPQSAVANMEE